MKIEARVEIRFGINGTRLVQFIGKQALKTPVNPG